MDRAENVLIAGEWRTADATGTFQATDPDTGEALEHVFPISSRRDVDAALQAGSEAARELAATSPDKIARFLEAFADNIEARGDEIARVASEETALPYSPRLREGELSRTTDQLRQAAAAARDGGWALPTIDTGTNIRSMYGPLGGPVVVFGPNNFPLAFNGVSGGDFAAAIAAGNPVIAKGHPSHPRTSQLLAEAAFDAVGEAGLPAATVQMIYRTDHVDGEHLVSHPLVGATGYTGSRHAGMILKAAADEAGKPIYLEMSSINPVFVLPGALAERGTEVAEELCTSALMGTGQFCTNPGIIVLQAGEDAESFIADMQRRFEEADAGPLLGPGGVKGLSDAVRELQDAGAELLVGGERLDRGCRFANTLMRTTGGTFLDDPERLQTEAFGNANLFVVADDDDQLERIATAFEGNLTGSLYTDTGGADDELYDRIAPHLRRRVGRLLNDKMPTGVAVVPAMNHGGPFPATGHPGFTAVGIPASIRRFAMLECYDEVREHRLPPALRDANPTGELWRFIDRTWTQADVES